MPLPHGFASMMEDGNFRVPGDLSTVVVCLRARLDQGTAWASERIRNVVLNVVDQVGLRHLICNALLTDFDPMFVLSLQLRMASRSQRVSTGLAMALRTRSVAVTTMREPQTLYPLL